MTIKDKKRQNLKPKGHKKGPQRLVPAAKDAEKCASKDQKFKERWLELNSDVHTALCYWKDLTEKYDGKMSRDQEQLHEIKTLLKDLQKKIKVFGE